MAVLAFLHSTDACKIYPMKIYVYLLSVLFISILYDKSQTAEYILFPLMIDIQDLKSKMDAHVTIADIMLNPQFDMDIVIPRNQ